MNRFVIAMLAAALLSGCQSTGSTPTMVTKIAREKVVIPASLQDCPDEPVFKVRWDDEDAVIDGIDRIAAAGAECRRNLRATTKIIKRFNDAQ